MPSAIPQCVTAALCTNAARDRCGRGAMSVGQHGSQLGFPTHANEDVVSVSSSEVDGSTPREEELMEKHVRARFPMLILFLQRDQGIAQWGQHILRVKDSVEEAELLAWRAEHKIRCLGLKRTWSANSSLRKSQTAMADRSRRTAVIGLADFRRKFIRRSAWQRVGIGRQIPLHSGAQLFRRLLQVYPTARYQDYMENWRWNKQLLYIDLALMRAHRREVQGTQPLVEIESSPLSISS